MLSYYPYPSHHPAYHTIVKLTRTTPSSTQHPRTPPLAPPINLAPPSHHLSRSHPPRTTHHARTTHHPRTIHRTTLVPLIVPPIIPSVQWRRHGIGPRSSRCCSRTEYGDSSSTSFRPFWVIDRRSLRPCYPPAPHACMLGTPPAPLSIATHCYLRSPKTEHASKKSVAFEKKRKKRFSS